METPGELADIDKEVSPLYPVCATDRVPPVRENATRPPRLW